MELRPWWGRLVRILRHDLTLAVLVFALLAVSAGMLSAAHQAPADPGRIEIAAGLEVAAVEPPVSAPAPAEARVAAEAPLAVETPAPVAQASTPAEPAPKGRVIRGSLGPGETLARALTSRGASNQNVHVIAREMRGLFDFRRARAGHRYRLHLDDQGELIVFRYSTSELEGFIVRRQGDGFVAEREDVELRPQVARIAGVVVSSLHESIVSLGEKGQLANDFAEIFAWDVDFSRSSQPGDEYRILYERLYRQDGEEQVYVRPGRILAARYQGGVGTLSAVYFEPAEGRGGYYRADGSSVRGEFLRAPLRYSRISSRFTRARRHPILKITRPHHGIDYAAAHGTPVWSVADGKVIYRGWAGGFGNLVKVRHENGYVSYYAHLSRFSKGLGVGQRVQQKQVIGFVGQTGLATGPHVCFRIAKNGRFVDPARLHLPAGDPVPPERLPLFATARDLLFADLDSGPLVEVDQAL